MKDEIKEILEDVKRHLDYVNTTGLKSTRDNEMKAMYDYITNLQIIEQQYSAVLSENAELENKITNLQEENERLNNIIDELTEDIPHLLEIINRNEKDIKVYQDEWLAVSSLKYKLNDLKGDNK